MGFVCSLLVVLIHIWHPKTGSASWWIYELTSFREIAVPYFFVASVPTVLQSNIIILPTVGVSEFLLLSFVDLLLSYHPFNHKLARYLLTGSPQCHSLITQCAAILSAILSIYAFIPPTIFPCDIGVYDIPPFVSVGNNSFLSIP